MNSSTLSLERTVAVIAAVLLLQSLYFKFTAHPDSVAIFTTIGLEPVGRIGSGIAELIAGILLLWDRTRLWGGILSLGVISGALFFHFTSLGVEVNGDKILFLMAIVVFLCSSVVVLLRYSELKNTLGKLKGN
ncbi:MAG: DoxX family protein [Flavobacteriales bacterium]|nr:DoxX family protein [Flavobacteriales bacterium]